MNIHSPIHQAIQDLQNGRMILLTDDASRENEADFVMAADRINCEDLNFVRTHSSGIICVSLSPKICDRLKLTPMLDSNQANCPFQTPFTTSVDLKSCQGTGISISQRQQAIQWLSNPQANACDFTRPGHIFPLKSHPQGVLGRGGHTEGAHDLMMLANLPLAAMIVEAVDEQGESLKGEALTAFAAKHQITIISIQDIIDYRLKTETSILEICQTTLPTLWGDFECYAVKDKSHAEHLILKSKQPLPTPCPLRIHSACLTGDIFTSKRCDCGDQLKQSLDYIQKHHGIFIYLSQEGRGIGLFNKIKAYQLQEQGHDTIQANLALGLPADNRSYKICADICKYFSVQSIDLLTQNPVKIAQMESHGIHVAKRIDVHGKKYPENQCYLNTKKNKMEHIYNEDF